MEETMMHEEALHAKKSLTFGQVAIYAVAFLIPTLFIPFTGFQLDFSKTYVAVIGTTILLGVFVVKSLRSASVRLDWSLLMLSVWLLPLTYLVASFFSVSPSLSFWGYQLETDTFGFMFLLAALSSVVVLLLKREQLSGAFLALTWSALIVFVFQAIQVFLKTPFSLTILGNSTVNLVGNWNDFGVFAGLVASLTLVAYMSLRLKRIAKVFFAGMFGVALFFMALVNLTEAWVLFGLVALTFSVIVFAQLKRGLEMGRVTLPFIGLIVAVIFTFFGAGIAPSLQEAFNVSSLSVRPSVGVTLGIMQETYRNNLLVGTGPNTFSAQWLLHRPVAVLETVFWNSSFNVGSGTILTAFITGGLMAALAWLAFTLLSLYTLVRALFTVPVDGRSYTLTTLSGLGFVYLLAVHYIYVPVQSLSLLMAVFLGLFIVSLKGTPLVKQISFERTKSVVRQYASLVFGVLVLLIAIGAVYGVGQTYLSVFYHERAVEVANAGNLEQAAALIQKATALRPEDRYFRTGALIAIARLNVIVQNNDATDEALAAFRDKLALAIQYMNKAQEKNPHSFENWLTRAVVYSSVVPLGIEGAAENATAALEGARALSPQSPEVDYRLAQINYTTGATGAAKNLLQAAIGKKANYTDAILLLARIELAEGNLSDAIASVRSAVFFEPQNSLLLYQLGILLLQDKNYTEAASAFETAIQNQSDYANAQFFLAQTYAFLGKLNDAAALMAQIKRTNPDNALVGVYQAALEAGQNPFDPTQLVSPERESGGIE